MILKFDIAINLTWIILARIMFSEFVKVAVIPSLDIFGMIWIWFDSDKLSVDFDLRKKSYIPNRI